MKVWLRKLEEKFWKWLAWALPKRLVYWATIRLVTFSTSGKHSNTAVPELGAMTALKRYGDEFMKERGIYKRE